MLKRTQLQKKIPLLIILSMCPFFGACGGGGGEGDSTEVPTDSGGNIGAGLVCLAYVLVSGDDECVGYISSSSSSGGSGNSGGSSNSDGSSNSGGSGTVIKFKPIDEYEPNNEWLNANPVDFPRTTDRDGFIIDGGVHDVLDQVDAFTFTRTFLRYHAFRLCSDGQKYCDQSGEIDTLTAYIDIVDQAGKILASSQASENNFLRLELAGGVPHYVRVVAGDTMATTVQYHLVVHEANY
jgi:hypothetical protein